MVDGSKDIAARNHPALSVCKDFFDTINHVLFPHVLTPLNSRILDGRDHGSQGVAGKSLGGKEPRSLVL